MKRIFLALLPLFYLLAPAGNLGAEEAPAGSPARFVLGISPFLSREVKDQVFRAIAGFVLEQMPLDSTLAVYDGYHLKSVARFEIPNSRSFTGAKMRANQLGAPFSELRRFLAAEPEPQGTNGMNLRDAILLPQFLRFASRNRADSGRVIVIVLGSPLYADPREPRFSMVDGYFPSDGHLSATREQSVFGIEGASATLRDFEVHIGWFGDPWTSQLHQDKIERFWSLFMEKQGGALLTFCGDLPTLFRNVNTPPGELKPRSFAMETGAGKIEMLRISRDVTLTDWITRDQIAMPHQAPPTITRGPMKIGIRWQGDWDLDLYAKPSARAQTLSFEQTRSPEGYYFKDHRSSPSREYEFIEFEAPVDVWQVEASVNFYDGRAESGAEGEARVEFDGKIYVAPFSISARRGNQGRSGGSQEKNWARLNIPAILKLEQRSAQP